MLRPLNFAVLCLVLSVAARGQETPEPEEYVPGPLDQSVPVAPEEETPDDEGVSIDPPTEVTEEAILEAFARFRVLLDEQNYDAADIAAKRVVQMTIEFYGPQSHETAKALSNLAIVQHNNDQYEAAIQNFTSAIEILEIVEDRLNEQLVNPLRGLGAAQLGQGRPDLAAQSLGRATHITHVNEGPHNIQQVEILESQAEAMLRLGDIEAARDLRDRIHILNVRHFANDALGLLPSLMRRAAWQHRAGYYNDERATYRRAIRVIEEAAGRDDPRLVDPLVRLGSSFYYLEVMTNGIQRPASTAGELYLKRAVRIAEDADDMPWLEVAMAKLALGDFYEVHDSHNRARRIYKEVWDFLSVDEERLEMRGELMGDPQPIWEEPLPTYTNAAGAGSRRASDLMKGTISVNYTVSARGRVRVITTEASPAEFSDMQRMVHREIRRRVFRPQIVDGMPVESDEQQFQHEFYYRRSEAEELRKQRESQAETTAEAT